MRNINVGSINGGNNQFNQNNYNVKNVNTGGGGKGGGDPMGEGGAVLLAVFLVVVVTAFFYLRYFEPVIFWLKLGVLTAGVLHMMSFIPQWNDPNSGNRDLLHTLFGVLLAAAQAWVILATLEALPTEVIDIANRPTAAHDVIQQAMEVWNRFNSYGHRLITENLMTVLCLTPAIALNLFYAAQHLLETLASSAQSALCATFARWLDVCKKYGAPLSALLTLTAYLAISGVFSPRTL